MADEKLIWSGSPSQVVNLPMFIVCVLFIWLVFPAGIILWRWLIIRTTKYELTTERFRTRYGVLNKKLDELELYRVRDYKLDQPIWLRLFSLGNIHLHTADRSSTVVTVRAIRDCEEVREQIRTHVETCRVAKGVRDFEVS